MEDLQTQLLCEECGYDLRGSPQRGRCPECNCRYNKQTLLAKQSKSHNPMLFKLRIVGVLSAIYLSLAVMVVVAEEFVHVRRLPWEDVVAPTLVIGGPILLILYAIAVGEMRFSEVAMRPFYDKVSWALLPRRIKFWIIFDTGIILLGLFLIWGNPFWKMLLENMKKLLP